MRPTLRKTTVGADGSTCSSGSLRIPKRCAGPSWTGRSRTPRPVLRPVHRHSLSVPAPSSLTAGPPGSVSQETIRSSVGSGVMARSSRRASCPLISANSTWGRARRSASTRSSLLPSRASTNSREARLRSLGAMASGSSSETVVPENTTPGASTGPSSTAPPALEPLSFAGPCRRPVSSRRKAASARCSRRNALPVAHGSHSTRSSTPVRRGRARRRPAWRRAGARPRRPAAPERLDVVDGDPDAAEPFLHQVGVGPGAGRVPRARVVHPKRGPPGARQPMRQVTQRTRRVRGLQTHRGTEDRGTGDQTVVREVQPGEERPVRRPEPKGDGFHSVREVGLGRQATNSDGTQRVTPGRVSPAAPTPATAPSRPRH